MYRLHQGEFDAPFGTKPMNVSFGAARELGYSQSHRKFSVEISFRF